MGKSLLIALVAVVALVMWMLSGQLGSKTTSDSEQASATSSTDEGTAAPKMKVQTRTLQAQSIDREIVIQGQLEPAKVISVRSETAGTVASIGFSKGQRVTRGQTIATLTEGNRLADLAVAKANLAQVESEFLAADKLARQGLQSQLSLEALGAQREAAQAQVQAAELELDNITIRAPMDALLEDIDIEPGDYIDLGAGIATLVDDSSLLVTGNVSQQNIADVKTGQPANAKLVTGETLQGTVSYISSMADATTRSFEVEVLLTETPASVLTGISAEIIIPVETLMAHRVSPAILALDEDGTLGVKTLDEENKVEFVEIEVVRTESNGAWVTGLPAEATVITLGQGFVNPGEEVEPVADTQTNEDA